MLAFSSNLINVIWFRDNEKKHTESTVRISQDVLAYGQCAHEDSDEIGKHEKRAGNRQRAHGC